MKPSASRSLVAAALCALLLTAPGRARAAEQLILRNIDTAEFPVVRCDVSSPPSIGSTSDPRFTVSENGQQIDDVAVTRVAESDARAEVVLVMDTSGSMKGKALADAQAAAIRLIEGLGDGSRVAVVSFSDSPRVVAPFTADRARLEAAISSLHPAGETALHDALVVAAGLMAGRGGTGRSIVLLSDGGDTASAASFETAVESVSKTEVPVYAVALQTGEYNPGGLEVLTKGTGGRLVPVASSESLGSLFEGIAEEISSSWIIEYRSVRPTTKDVEVDVVARAGEAQATVSAAYPNPGVKELASGPLVVPEVTGDPRMVATIIVLGFISVTLLVVGLLLLLLRQRTSLDQLRYYDQLQEAAQAQGGVGDQMRTIVVDAVGSVAGRRGFTQMVARKLESAGMPLRPAEYITAHLLAVVALSTATQMLTGRLLLSFVVILLATLGPILAMDIAASRRRGRFEEQLPDVLTMIAGSLRGGWGIQQSIALASREAPAPSSTELKRVETETRLGMPLERSLQAMGDRMESMDFRAAANAIAIQREVGGNLAEVLTIVAQTIREREAMRRQVRALTAEGRLSSWILIALPFVVVFILMLTTPTYLLPLFTTASGLTLVAVGFVLLVVGSVWMYRVTRIEV